MGSIGENVTGFSISSKDSPVTVINQVFNYDKASVILEAIKGKFKLRRKTVLNGLSLIFTT